MEHRKGKAENGPEIKECGECQVMLRMDLGLFFKRNFELRKEILKENKLTGGRSITFEKTGKDASSTAKK